MLNDRCSVFQPLITSRTKVHSTAATLLCAYLQVLRTYWWWVPLLLLSMLAGSAVAAHHKHKLPSEAKPTLFVEKTTKSGWLLV